MQAQHFINETNCDPDFAGTKQALRVVIAHSDLAGGKRTMRVMADFGKILLHHPVPRREQHSQLS